MDDVEMLASIMVNLADLVYRPVVEEKYGKFLDKVKDLYLELGAQAMALGEEKKFHQALSDLCEFSQRQSHKVLRPE